MKRINKMSGKTLKLYVENVNLTVNYYKEYAGFNLLESSPAIDFMDSAIMNFQNNILLFEKADDIHNIYNQEIIFQLCLNNEQLKELYDNYKQKMKINHVSFYEMNQIKEFSIKDCDGNIISFKIH